MASADLLDELTCAICTDIYRDPAVTVNCGHSFCHECITSTWKHQEKRKYFCPECFRRFRVRPLIKRDLRLSNITESLQSIHSYQEQVGIPCTYCFRFMAPAVKTCLHCETFLCEDHLRVHSKSPEHVLTEPTALRENWKCCVHRMVLKYYCLEESVFICVSCSLAGEHRGYRVETLNEASEKKEKLRNILQKLTSQREEVKKSVQNLEEFRRHVQEKAAGVTEGITVLIRDIREQAETPEKEVLSEISRQEEQISLRVSDLIRQLEIKKEELTRKMGDIEKLCDMTYPLTVLQGRESDRDDYCDAERYDIKVHDLGELIKVTLYSGLAGIVTAVTRWCRILEASDMSLDVNTASDMLLDIFNTSCMSLGVNTASDVSLDVNTASDMSMDVNTASNYVSVSDDLKTVSWSEMTQSRPDTPERFQDFRQVLSSSSFSSGRHYWEVEVSESGWWVVGMVYPTIERRGDQSAIGINSVSWGLGRGWFNNQYSVIHDSKLIQLPHSSSSHRLGILLDYEVGRLSFYELCDSIRHLHTFTAVFTEPLRAVFGVYRYNSSVRI